MYTLLVSICSFVSQTVESLFVCSYICYYVYTCKPALTSDYRHELHVTTFGLLCSSDVVGYNYSSYPDMHMHVGNVICIARAMYSMQ